MTQEKIQDERILQERRFIQSRGYAWLNILLLLSVVVQMFFLKAPPAQYGVELVLFIGCGLYNAVSNLRRGINLWSHPVGGKKNVFLDAVITGVIGVIVFAILSGETQAWVLTAFFAAMVASCFGARLAMNALVKRKQNAMDKALDEEE